MPKNDSRRDAEPQRKRAFQSSLSSHPTVIPYTVAQASDFLSLSASRRLCARFLLHGYGLAQGWPRNEDNPGSTSFPPPNHNVVVAGLLRQFPNRPILLILLSCPLCASWFNPPPLFDHEGHQRHESDPCNPGRSRGPRPGGPTDDSPARKRWVPSPHAQPAPAGATEPLPPHEHRIRLHRSSTPRNPNRISPIHPAEISRRGAEPLRSTGNRKRGHP